MDANPAIFDGGNAEAAMESGAEIVAVALERKGQLDDALGRHPQTTKTSTERDAGDQGRGTASQAAADGNRILDMEVDAAERPRPTSERLLCGAQQKIPVIERHLIGALAMPGDARG